MASGKPARLANLEREVVKLRVVYRVGEQRQDDAGGGGREQVRQRVVRLEPPLIVELIKLVLRVGVQAIKGVRSLEETLPRRRALTTGMEAGLVAKRVL